MHTTESSRAIKKASNVTLRATMLALAEGHDVSLCSRGRERWSGAAYILPGLLHASFKPVLQSIKLDYVCI